MNQTGPHLEHSQAECSVTEIVLTLFCRVVCEELGLTNDSYEPIAIYGNDVPDVLNSLVPIFISGVNCSGSEVTLLSCPYSNVTDHCTHHYDAGVNCHPDPNGIYYYYNLLLLRKVYL